MYFNVIYLVVISALSARSESSFQLAEWEYVPFELPPQCGSHASRPCLMKCCAADEVILLNKDYPKLCKTTQWMETFFGNLSMFSDKFGTYDDLKIKTIDGGLSRMQFSDFYVFRGRKCLELARAYKGDLLETGEVNLTVFDSESKVQTPPKFCFDMGIGKSKRTGLLVHTYIYMVWNDEAENSTRKPDLAKLKIDVGGKLTSAVFLAAVVSVYAAVRPLRRRLYDMLVMAYVCSMCLTFTVQAVCQLHVLRGEPNCVHVNTNAILCPIFYFFYITTFLWLTLMSFNIWCRFRFPRLGKRCSVGTVFRKSFLRYWAAVWAAGAVATGTLLVLDHWPSKVLPQPRFDYCLSGDSSLWYVYLPISVSVLCNTAFYALTCYNMWRSAAAIKHFHKKLSKREREMRRDNNMLFVGMKVYLIMGLGWIIDIIVAYIPNLELNVWQYALVSSPNMFNGLLVFIVLVVKRRVISMLCRRLNIQNRWIMSVVGTNAAKASVTDTFKSSKSHKKTTVDSIQIEECHYFSQSDEGNEKRNTVRFIEKNN